MKTDLIVNSGIQFISIPVNLNEDLLNSVIVSFSEKIVDRTASDDIYTLLKPYYWREEEIYLEYESINEEAFDSYGEVKPDEIKREYVEEVDSETVYKVRGAEAVKVCEGHWVPLPFFRIRRDPQNPFHHGPENWCRGNLQQWDDPDGVFTHQFTLAFDTSAENIQSSAEYKKPRNQDASDNGSERFKCVLDSRKSPKFFTNEGVTDWMFNLYWLNPENKSSKDRLRHIAVYHVLLELLGKAGAFPEVGLLSGENTVNVGLAIDIGNSRTCGLLSEKKPYDKTPFSFTSARKLQIRNLSKPHEICEKPFDMQVAFAEENFGNQAADLFDDVFEWRSMVRVGDEAISLTSIFESEDSLATMSSPKRYLWDKSTAQVPWIKVDRDGRMGYHEDVDVKKYALFGFADLITSKGELIRERDADRIMAATESRYSKSSLMTFAIYEILQHTISQINSYQFRKDQGQSTFRRLLKDIVLTCPTAMTEQEQFALRKAAMDAVELLRYTVGDSIELNDLRVTPKLPNLNPEEQTANPWKYDEATCSQLSYLYGEIAQKFNGNKELFFEINGKLRSIDDGEPAQTFTLASIDIGGGTSDLMICNYAYDREADIPFITPTPLFWEGFNIAGDDIVKRVIEYVLLPEIERNLVNLGGQNVSATLNELFGPDIGGITSTEKINRRQFANQVATPFAFEALEHVRFHETKSEVITINDVFLKHPKPESGLIEYIEAKIRKRTGVEEFNLCKMDINLNPTQINHGIQDVMGNVLKQLGYVIAQYDCDVILLSGRPSRLPVIRKILSDTLSFSPDKIVGLGNYRFGHWYPFADSEGVVGDPKSSVCVGAMIAYLNSQGRLPGLRIDLDSLNKIQSTASYIGVMDSNCEKISVSDVLLAPEQNEGEFKFWGEPVNIGMRQLASEDWIASPLYIFDFKSDAKRASFMKQEYSYPLTVTVRRAGNTGEFLSKEDLRIVDKTNIALEDHYFDFSFRTTSNQVHWKDTGSFIVNIDNN